ncbi:MAG: hypothetical protein NDI61_10200 [Bdellovibrionaceae bacterium]|nr:hypothetical protein [Pseudobdellovibrionaceae bacterium]
MDKLTANEGSEPLETDAYGRASGASAEANPNNQNSSSTLTTGPFGQVGPAAAPMQMPFLTAGLIHTRCPACRKLFATDPLPPSDDLALFQCSDCEAQFTIEMPNEMPNEKAPGSASSSLGGWWVESQLFQAAGLTFTETELSPVTTQERPAADLPADRRESSVRAAVEPVAQRAMEPAAQKSAAAKKKSELATTVPDEEAFAAELALGAKPELILLWKEIIDHYEIEAKHDAFLSACLKNGALAYAAHKYGRILQQFPDEEIARKMTKRLVALASAPAETATELSKPLLNFRMPGLNSVVIVLGTVVSLMGISLPGLQNMTGVGAAMVALALGLRFFAQRSEL